MINDMDYHINAWYDIVNRLGAGLTLDQVKAQCYGKNHELLERIFPGRFSMIEMDMMGLEKEQTYQNNFHPYLKLLPGLDKVLEKATEQGIRMAIGSAAIRYNIDFVLDGLRIRDYFKAVVGAEDVATSKPDPQTFLSCAQQLGVAPSECLVFEDAPKGVEAAANAGMDAVVLTTMHEAHEFNNGKNIVAYIRDYELLSW